MTNLMFLQIYYTLSTIKRRQRKNARINLKAISFRHDWINFVQLGGQKWTTNVRSESKSSVTSALRREIWGMNPLSCNSKREKKIGIDFIVCFFFSLVCREDWTCWTNMFYNWNHRLGIYFMVSPPIPSRSLGSCFFSSVICLFSFSL